MHKDHHPAAAPTPAASGSGAALDMDAFWMPFTASRQFKSAPRLLAKAKDMHYWTPEGRQVLDAVAGLWCVNAGHSRPKIVRAIAEQARRWTSRRRSTWPIPSRSSWRRSWSS
jgi:beta-alanine--pyruvate transaminase